MVYLHNANITFQLKNIDCFSLLFPIQNTKLNPLKPIKLKIVTTTLPNFAIMEINPDDIVNIDYSAFDKAVQKIKPTVYVDGDAYCCLSGPDPESGVFGCGSTPNEAVEDWQKSLIDKLNASPRNDEAARKVREELGIGELPMSDHVKDFINQFYPRKKK